MKTTNDFKIGDEVVYIPKHLLIGEKNEIMITEEKYLEAVKVVIDYESKQLNKPVVKRSFDYKIISAHNADLYEYGKWAYKHLIELGKQGYEIIKVQEIHDCGSCVLLKKENGL